MRQLRQNLLLRHARWHHWRFSVVHVRHSARRQASCWNVLHRPNAKRRQPAEQKRRHRANAHAAAAAEAAAEPASQKWQQQQQHPQRHNQRRAHQVGPELSHRCGLTQITMSRSHPQLSQGHQQLVHDPSSTRRSSVAHLQQSSVARLWTHRPSFDSKRQTIQPCLYFVNMPCTHPSDVHNPVSQFVRCPSTIRLSLSFSHAASHVPVSIRRMSTFLCPNPSVVCPQSRCLYVSMSCPSSVHNPVS